MLNAAQLALLRTELTTDPATLGYAAPIASGSDSGVLALTTDRTKGATLPRPLDQNQLITWAASRGVLQPLVAGTTNDNVQLASMCLAVQSFLSGGAVTLDLTSSTITTMLAALASAGILNANAATGQPIASGSPADLLAYASAPSSRADVVLGYGVVPSLTDIAVALRGNG